ncbi:hypothetical protein H0H92_006754 [Tricholoma furcatifolium]|nr:hypothetical protein H0H92_006754 [Tricholoma furcatifolium]
MQTQHNAPSDNTTSVYIRSLTSIPPIAKARRYKPRPEYCSDEHEWLAGPLTNLGDHTLGRGDTVLLADILRPPPPYDVPAHLGYPEVQLIMPTPYTKGHYMEAGWAAYLVEDTFTHDLFTVHFPKRVITADTDTPAETHSPGNPESAFCGPRPIIEEITRRRSRNPTEIRVQTTTETVCCDENRGA